MASTPRKRLAKVAGLVAGAAMVAVPLTATTASASPAAAGESARVQGMTFYDDYWTLKECKTVGQWGLDHGKWTVYDCQESPWDWDLYVDK